jgi:hypothetical protein
VHDAGADCYPRTREFDREHDLVTRAAGGGYVRHELLDREIEI